MMDKTKAAFEENSAFKTLKADAFNRLVKQHVLLDEESSRRELCEKDRKLFMDQVKIQKADDGNFEIVKGAFWKMGDKIEKAIFQAALNELLESIELLSSSEAIITDKPDCSPLIVPIRINRRESSGKASKENNQDSSVSSLVDFQKRTRRKT
jgi:hypothetical protein